jgi:hypothetical protein
MDDITLLQVLDEYHIRELIHSWKTWETFKPEIINLPSRFVYDKDCENSLNKIEHILCRKNITLQPFTNKHFYSSQREAMLTSFFEGIKNISTKFYLKIDTDTIATNDNKGWIKEIEDRDKYTFIAKGWSISFKEHIEKLQIWADINPELSKFERVSGFKEHGDKKLKKKRITSWFFVGNVEWNNHWSNYCLVDNHYSLPAASHDTFLWYIAERSKSAYKTVNFKAYGFDHGKMKV